MSGTAMYAMDDMGSAETNVFFSLDTKSKTSLTLSLYLYYIMSTYALLLKMDAFVANDCTTSRRNKIY